jgi:hypothetical protein
MPATIKATTGHYEAIGSYAWLLKAFKADLLQSCAH